MAKPIELCTTQADPMARVLKHFSDSPTALAVALSEKLGIQITPQRVNNWRNEDVKMPVEMAFHIESLTGFVVLAEELRPDQAQSIKTMRDDLARFYVQKDVAE